MVTDHQEIEWQYDAPHGLEKVEEWLDGRAWEELGLPPFRGSLKELTNPYHDPEEGQLSPPGSPLRFRRKAPNEAAEVTIKSIVPPAGTPHRRREISEPLTGDGLDALQK